MARKPTSMQPERRELSSADLRSGITRLNRRIEELKVFDITASSASLPPELEALEKAIEDSLERIFGQGTTQYYRYHEAARLAYDAPSFYVMGFDHEMPETSPKEVQQAIAANIEKSVQLLRQAVRSLEEDLSEEASSVVAVEAARPQVGPSRKVFVVHGHDEAAKEKTARFLEKLAFKPVILHDEANAGQTIIEKFEKHGDVGFAVVLLTPDDIGGAVGQPSQPRARQNVVLELGYFIGRLGRSRVCALKTASLELPSDFSGVVYEEMDANGAWHRTLARELQVAGYEIDWNIVMKP